MQLICGDFKLRWIAIGDDHDGVETLHLDINRRHQGEWWCLREGDVATRLPVAATAGQKALALRLLLAVLHRPLLEGTHNAVIERCGLINPAWLANGLPDDLDRLRQWPEPESQLFVDHYCRFAPGEQMALKKPGLCVQAAGSEAPQPGQLFTHQYTYYSAVSLVTCLVKDEQGREWHFQRAAFEPHAPEYPYFIHCGGLETMEKIAARGVKGLNGSTMRYQVISKTAQYRVIKDFEGFGEEGRPYSTGELWCNEDLKEIARQKGLIL